MSGQVPVVILNWNGTADTLACLRSIRAADTAGFVPVVVDNGSNREALEQLRQGCREIYPNLLTVASHELAQPAAQRRARLAGLAEGGLLLVESPENLGFARGSNLGVPLAEALDSPWLMLLNNDTVVRPDTFAVLRRCAAAHPEFTALTAQIQDFEPGTRIQNCGGDLTYFGSRRYHYAGADAAAAPKRECSVVTFVTGCALLYNFRDVGALSEDFFFGEEDYEFSLRLQRLGRRMACVHGAVVHHKFATSITKAARPLGFVVANYATRLVNVRNYYSPARWHATRLLAYLYLPLLLARRGIAPSRSFAAVRMIEAHLRRHRGVGRTEFQALLAAE